MRRGPKPAKSKEAKPPVGRKSSKDDGARVLVLEKSLAEVQGQLQARDRELTEALDQQTATSEILKVISSSPTDIQPVFDAIAVASTKLCAVESAGVYRFDGVVIHFAAHHGWTAEQLHAIGRVFPQSLDADSVTARAIRTRSVVHIPDISVDPEYRARPIVEAGFRTVASVPMLRPNAAIGAITVTRLEVAPLTDRQIELLKTFAEQAVIAVENVRLFTKLQASNQELSRALDAQTATSDILRVINRSHTGAQPVFDTIVDSAVRVLRGHTGALTRITGEQLDLAAATHVDDASDATLRATFPRLLGSEWPHAHAIRDHVPLNIADAQTDPRVPDAGHAEARVRGYRSLVVLPMLRHDAAVGTLSVTRREPGGFTGDEIALLQTLADQAVIAIEDARLLTELQEKNRALTEAHFHVTEALEQQTATSDVLRVISSSPTDVQPVFDSIAASALRLCDARLCTVFRFDGELIHLVALQQVSTEGAAAYRNAYPARPGRGGGTHRAILTGGIVHIPDIRDDPEYELQDLARANQFGCVLSVPMFRDGHPIGAITVGREAARPFSDAQIELLRTFADQAVIAIENARLFSELQQALERQTATAEILRVISE